MSSLSRQAPPHCMREREGQLLRPIAAAVVFGLLTVAMMISKEG